MEQNKFHILIPEYDEKEKQKTIINTNSHYIVNQLKRPQIRVYVYYNLISLVNNKMLSIFTLVILQRVNLPGTHNIYTI